MANQTTGEIRPESTHAKNNHYQSLFNLIKRTPQGPRVICQDLTFEQAICLIAEIPGTLALKFSKMGALL